jgi:hypothetical protein
MTQEQLVANKVDYAKIGEAISHELAGKMIKDYNDAHPEQEDRCFTIGKNIIESILAQPGCVSMRFYNAVDENGIDTLVYVGVDAKGHTIMEITTINEIGKLGKVPAIVADRSKTDYVWG